MKIDKSLLSGFKSNFSKFSDIFKNGGNMDVNDFVKESGITVPTESDITTGNIDMGSELNSELNLNEISDITGDYNLNEFGL